MVHSQRGNKAALFIYEPNSFVPLATVQDQHTYWYQNDQIGAPQELTNEQGQVVWAADYKVWGEASVRTTQRTGTDDAPTSSKGAWHTTQAAPSSTPAIEQPFRFQGQQFDEESGLHYNRFRYYDPVVGRFASQDPIGLLGGLNNAAYGPNSANWVDALGLSGNSAQRRKAKRADSKKSKPCPDKCPCPTAGHLYRGVSADHPALDAAKVGRVEPALNSGGASAAQHNAGGHSGNSQYTSWTRSLDYAKVHANKSGPGGVVLSAPLGAPGPGDCWSWEFSDDVYHEQEVLLKGPRAGLGVHKP
jgi:RHS repeat-associated protein